MDNAKLKKILENHRHWLNEDCEGWENMRADLSNADLRYAELRCADLRYANLRNTDLTYTDLRSASLHNADLRNTDLRNADLRYAALHNANLRNADLRNADLRYATLHNTDLRNADLTYANLINADLRSADLRYADLRYVNMTGVRLRYAYNLDKTIGLYLPIACPSDGEFTAWKKCRDGVIAKLLIPADAKRTSATGRKCRASEAVVLALYDKDGNEITEARSNYDNDFVYRVGETVKPKKPFDDNRWDECASGIHFFVTREEAERYE